MLTMKDIVKDDNPKLRVKCQEVSLPPSEEDVETILTMKEYVLNSQDAEISKKYKLRSAVGLAAPQIGVEKRMIAIHMTDFDDTLYSYTLFNPKIISHSVELTYLSTGEGCLSVEKDVPGIVPRYARIRVRGYDINGEKVELKLKGMPSIVFQHEIDHLNGIVFYDHINKKNPLAVPEGATPISRPKAAIKTE